MVPLFMPYMPNGISAGLEQILYSGKLAYGANGRAFEIALGKYLNTSQLITVSSFGSGMELLLSLFEIGPGCEVIMSPMSCLRSSQPVICSGANIVWGDVDPTTGTLSPDSVRNKVSTKTKLILNYHHLGYVGYVDEINAVAAEAGIPVIEDGLDGVGNAYKGRKTGTCSEAGIFSLDAVRLPNAIEGAVIVFKDQAYFERAKLKRDLGVDRTRYRDELGEVCPGCDVRERGFAATLNEVNSFIGLSQMSMLEELFNRRREKALFWQEYLRRENIEAKPLREVGGSIPNYWVFGVLTDHKMDLLKQFRSLGYYASGIHFHNNHYSVFNNYEELPGVEEFYRRFLGLPTGWWMK